MKNPLREIYEKEFFGSPDANLVRLAMMVFVEEDLNLRKDVLNPSSVSPVGPVAALTQLPPERFQAAIRELLEAKELVAFEEEGRAGYTLRGWNTFIQLVASLGYCAYMRKYRKKQRGAKERMAA